MLRLITALFAVLILNGCASYDAATMARFDNNEYLLAGKVSAIAEIAKSYCGDPGIAGSYATTIWVAARELQLYSFNRNENKDVIELTGALYEIAEGLGKKYMAHETAGAAAPSADYCKLKMKSLSASAAKVQEAMGDKEL
mgnify:CR=1 FL=1